MLLLSFGFFGFGFFVFAFSSTTTSLFLCFLVLFAAVAEAAFLIVEDTAAAAAILLAVVGVGIVDEIVVDVVAFVAVAVAGKAGGGGGGGATVLFIFSVMVAEAAMGTAEVAEGGSTLELEIEDGNDGSNSVVFDVERGSGGRGADGSGAVTSLPTATAPPDADDGAIISVSVADADAKVETAGSCFELSLLALWLLLAVWSPRPLSATGIAVSGAAAVSSAGGGVGGIIMVEMNCFCVEGRLLVEGGRRDTRERVSTMAFSTARPLGHPLRQ